MSKALNAIGTLFGLAIGALLDAVVFGAIAAIPLAALVYLTIISQPTAIVVIGIVAGLAVLRVLVVGLLQSLS